MDVTTKKLSNMKQLPIFIFLVCFAIITTAQQEQVEVIGGIEADSLIINNLPAFRAETKQTYDIVANANNTAVLLNDSWTDSPVTNHATPFDNGSNFDPATGIFTVPRDGIFQMRCELQFVGNRFFDDIIEAFISIDGNTTDNCIRGNFTLTSGGNTGGTLPAKITRSFGGILHLKKGEEVSLYVTYISGAGFEDFVMDAYTSFSGFLITDID